MKTHFSRTLRIALICLFIGAAALLLYGLLGLKAAFSTTFTADQAGYYSVLLDYELDDASRQTLSVYVNDTFARKILFSPSENETVTIPVYFSKGANKISLKCKAGDGKVTIRHAQIQARTEPTKMVIAPHEDDETLAFAGSIMRMVAAGDDVIVVFVSNGDWKGAEMGKERLAESARALALLGVPQENIIIMGYPDAELINLHAAGNTNTVLKLNHGETHTYGNEPLNLFDFHLLQNGRHAKMTGKNIRSDLLDILSVHRPAEIYVTSPYDTHEDHAASYHLTLEAVRAIQKTERYDVLLHETIVHGYNDQYWPERMVYDQNEGMVITAFTPPFPDADIPLKWEDAVHVELTPEMIARKYEAVEQYVTQNVIMGWADQNYAFVKSDEFYWTTDLSQ